MTTFVQQHLQLLLVRLVLSHQRRNPAHTYNHKPRSQSDEYHVSTVVVKRSVNETRTRARLKSESVMPRTRPNKYWDTENKKTNAKLLRTVSFTTLMH